MVRTGEMDWVPSPMAGVDRRMLDRIGDEVARATSIVRYAAGSHFSEHTHSGGEEFIVLEGVFQDEHGDYPAGTYVRNPIGTHHIPRSDPGCTIFVKLWQFAKDDADQFSLNLNSLELSADPNVEGVSRAQIVDRPQEAVFVEAWEPGTETELGDAGGVEILILEGELNHAGETYHRNDWIRLPAGERTEFKSGAEGVRFWMKCGHLSKIAIPG